MKVFCHGMNRVNTSTDTCCWKSRVVKKHDRPRAMSVDKALDDVYLVSMSPFVRLYLVRNSCPVPSSIRRFISSMILGQKLHDFLLLILVWKYLHYPMHTTAGFFSSILETRYGLLI